MGGFTLVFFFEHVVEMGKSTTHLRQAMHMISKRSDFCTNMDRNARHWPQIINVTSHATNNNIRSVVYRLANDIHYFYDYGGGSDYPNTNPSR